MSWRTFKNLTDQDMLAIYTYLSALPCLEGGPNEPANRCAAPVKTKAVADPKNAAVVAGEIQLDGSKSTSANGQPLTYQWSVPKGSRSAAILNGDLAIPTVQFPGPRYLRLPANGDGLQRYVFVRPGHSELRRQLAGRRLSAQCQLVFPKLASVVRRTPWSAADAPVGSRSLHGPERAGPGGPARTRGSAPHRSPVTGKLSGIGLSACCAETHLGVLALLLSDISFRNVPVLEPHNPFLVIDGKHQLPKHRHAENAAERNAH
jgi:hypothetical protein